MTQCPRPRVENAPGLVWKPRSGGWEARWQARSDLVRQGYLPKYVRLWCGVEPNEVEAQVISETCNTMQGEMLLWGRGNLATARFSGTLATLIDCYLRDPDSGFVKLRFKTRENYMSLCRRLTVDHGDVLVDDIKARNLLRWHEDWTAKGRIAMAHSLVGMLRMLINFGMTILEDDECARVSAVLSKMKFPMGKPRLSILTAKHAIALRAEAHNRGLHSMALAQAFQFECMLRQKDVIGEWVPLSEPGLSDVTAGYDKWLRGLRWEEISDNLILRHTTSKRQKEIEIDLKLAPMVMEELERIPNLQNGPVIVSDLTGLPWVTHVWRRIWREVADAAGIPRDVRNMDSRAGAITEATEVGADLEHIKHAATHSDIGMTQRYSRGSAEKTAKVMQLRAAYRNRK